MSAELPLMRLEEVFGSGDGNEGDTVKGKNSQKIREIVAMCLSPVNRSASEGNLFPKLMVENNDQGSQADLLQVENQQLCQSLEELKRELQTKEERAALEVLVYKEGQEKQANLVEKLQNKVALYRDKCNEMESKLESVIASSGAEPASLPSAVRQLEMKVKQLRKEKQEIETAHLEEIQGLMSEAIQQGQRAIQLAASNSALRQQLDASQQTVDKLSDQICKLSAKKKETEEEMQTRSSMQTEQCKASLTTALHGASTLREEFRRSKAMMTEDMVSTKEEVDAIVQELQNIAAQEKEKNEFIFDQLNKTILEKQRNYDEVHAELMCVKMELSSIQSGTKMTMTSMEKELTTVRTLYQEAKQSLEVTKLMLEKQISHEETSKRQVAQLYSAFQDSEAALQQSTSDVATLRNAMKSIVMVFAGKPTKKNESEKSGLGGGSPASPPIPIITISSDSNNEFSGEAAVSRMVVDNKDPSQLASWAIESVQQGANSQSSLICQLQSEVAKLREEKEDAEESLAEIRKEVSSRTTTSDILTNNLDHCKTQLEELSATKTNLQEQLEQANCQTEETEGRLNQCQYYLDSVGKEKAQMEAGCMQLQDAISALYNEIAKSMDVRDTTEMEMEKKTHHIHKLKLQLKHKEEEVAIMQDRITQLHAERLTAEKEMCSLKLEVAALQTDRDNLHQELSEVQCCEEMLMGTISDLQEVNIILQSDKRSLLRSLDEMIDVKEKLIETKTLLEETQFAYDREMEQVAISNKQLSEKVGDLDFSLREMEISCSELLNERDNSRQEADSVSEALRKTKQALAEVQIQRGKLNNSLARTTQEKGELVQEKVRLSSETAHLKESLCSYQEQLAQLSTEKAKLQDGLEETMEDVLQARAQIESMQKAHLATLEDNHRKVKENTRALEHKEESLRSMQQSHMEEMKLAVAKAKNREADLESSIKALRFNHRKRLTETEHAFHRRLIEEKEDAKESIQQLKDEMASMGRKHRSEITHLTHDKELIVANMNSERELLQERVSNLQKLTVQKSKDLKEEKDRSYIVIAELKEQHSVAQMNADSLAEELNQTEQEIQSMQGKLDKIKSDAESQIATLNKELIKSASKIAQLEETTHEVQATQRQASTSNLLLKKHLDETQVKLEDTANALAGMESENVALQSKLSDSKLETQKTKELLSEMMENVVKLEGEKADTQENMTKLRKVMRQTEKTLTKLTSEQTSLQTLITASEHEICASKMKVNELTRTVSKLEKEKEESRSSAADLNSRIKILVKACEIKEGELATSYKLMEDMRRERYQLSSSLAKLQGSADSQQKVMYDQISKMEEHIRDLTQQSDKLTERNATTDASLEAERLKNEELATINAALQEAKKQLTMELEQATAIYQGLRSSYFQLVGVLEVTLEKQLREVDLSEEERESEYKTHKPFMYEPTSSPESGIASLSSSHISHELSPFSRAAVHLTSKKSLNAAKVRGAVLMLQQQLSKAQSSKQFANMDLCLARKQSSEFQLQNAQLEEKVRTLQTVLAQSNSQLEVMMETNEQLEMSCSDQEAEVSKLMRKIRDLGRETEQAQEKLEEAQLVGQAADAKLRRYMDNLLSTEAKKRDLQKRLEEKELQEKLTADEVDELKRENQLLRKQEERKDGSGMSMEDQFQAVHDLEMKIKTLEDKVGESILTRQAGLRAMDGCYALAKTPRNDGFQWTRMIDQDNHEPKTFLI